MNSTFWFLVLKLCTPFSKEIVLHVHMYKSTYSRFIAVPRWFKNTTLKILLGKASNYSLSTNSPLKEKKLMKVPPNYLKFFFLAVGTPVPVLLKNKKNIDAF